MKRLVFGLFLCTQILGVWACPILPRSPPTPTATRTLLPTTTPAPSPTKESAPSPAPPPTSTPTVAPTPTPTPIPVAYSIAFASDREGNGEIYRFDGEAPPVNLTRHPASDWNPAWSPDSNYIAFASNRYGLASVSDRYNNNEIYVMNADGNDPTRLTKNTYRDYDPAWSPDGTKIVFIVDRYGDELFDIIFGDGSN